MRKASSTDGVHEYLAAVPEPARSTLKKVRAAIRAVVPPEATEAIGRYGVMIKSPTGFPIQSPYLSIANRQAEIMMRIASEFGFTPASRGRISVTAEDEPNLFDGIEHGRS